MTGDHDQPQLQPQPLSTGERLETTLGAVTQGIRYTLRSEHERKYDGGPGRTR